MMQTQDVGTDVGPPHLVHHRGQAGVVGEGPCVASGAWASPPKHKPTQTPRPPPKKETPLKRAGVGQRERAIFPLAGNRCVNRGRMIRTAFGRFVTYCQVHLCSRNTCRRILFCPAVPEVWGCKSTHDDVLRNLRHLGGTIRTRSSLGLASRSASLCRLPDARSPLKGDVRARALDPPARRCFPPPPPL